MSGFGFDLSAETAGDGTYTIADVPDHDAYAAFVFTADGYEMKTQQDVVVAGDVSIDKALFRDWAALSGGATLKSFTPPDYLDFCGTNANGAFDLNLGSGWPSDSVRQRRQRRGGSAPGHRATPEGGGRHQLRRGERRFVWRRLHGRREALPDPDAHGQ